ncbi:MAG: hypothetical protein R6V85_05335 [Polyangia bacterium]
MEHTKVFCPLPQLAAAQHCSDIGDQQQQNLNDDFGWYYCENTDTENFNEACDDDLDNDGDGLYDCEDDDCSGCPVCGGSGMGCEQTCKYVVQLTEEARNKVQNQSLSVQCIQQFSFEDPNCRENTSQACNDGLDNDGNGIWDCSDELGDDAERPHMADPNCCPMHVGDDNRCVIEDEALDLCEMTKANPSDACVAHAQKLECEL